MKQRSIFLFVFATILACSTILKAQRTAAEYFEEGVNKSKTGDFVAALQAFNLAITMSPENAPSYYNRAMAKANLRIQQGSYSPTLGLAAGWTRQQSSGHTSNLPQTITQYSDATLSMNWEIDVFGSIRNRVKAQKENFAASKEDYNAVMVSLCAQVASAYINLRELQQESC